MHAPSATYYVGVDVAKDTLAIRRNPAAKIVVIPNTSDAVRLWLTSLSAGAHLICEATGRHHRLLQSECAVRGVPYTCLNPARARAFALSLGCIEKSDPIDAGVLERFGRERQPPATVPPSPALRELSDLLMARRTVVEQVTAFTLRLPLLSTQARRALQKVIIGLRAQRLSLDLALEAWLESPQGACWCDKVYTLCLAPGVGVLSALSLIAHLPELGTLNRGQAAKLAGLAPILRDSGTMKGLRTIKGGRREARRVLYQCAMVAARWHLPTKQHYQQLLQRGKCASVAIIAIARKLLIYLNSLLRPASAATPLEP
jgi:transposase